MAISNMHDHHKRPVAWFWNYKSSTSKKTKYIKLHWDHPFDCEINNNNPMESIMKYYYFSERPREQKKVKLEGSNVYLNTQATESLLVRTILI